MTAQYLGQIERGQNMPRLECALNLAEAFQIDAGDLARSAGRRPKVAPIVHLFHRTSPAE